jgi:predicted DNA-binding protein (UPF0251 family)
LEKRLRTRKKQWRNEVKIWPKGVVFWTEKGGWKSSDKKRASVSVSESNLKKREGRAKQKFVYAEPKAKNAGRPNCLDEEKLTRLFDAYYSKPYSFRELADMFGVSRMTVWRAVQEAPGGLGGR